MKNILIVGGSSGIGLELVRLLKDTHQVLVASRTPGPLASMGVTHLPIDVTDADGSLPGLPETLDGLVYCPGSVNLKPFKMLGVETFRADLELNFLGLIKILQPLMPRFREGASLVFFSSVAVGRGMPFHTSVSASKGAVEGFARALAAEYAPRLRVNVIAPSLVETPLTARMLNHEKKRENLAARHPLGRVGQPADIARMAAFLLSEDSSWVSGQILGVDGGVSTLQTP